MTQSTSRLLLSWTGVLCARGFPAGNICQTETVFPGAAWQRATPESQGVDHDFRGRYGFYWWINGVMRGVNDLIRCTAFQPGRAS